VSLMQTVDQDSNSQRGFQREPTGSVLSDIAFV
jgi:hypothetical protein